VLTIQMQTEAEALEIARQLINLGVPMFLASPRADRPGGFYYPEGWQFTRPDPTVVDRWRPGMALCAVMGQVFDVIDHDPRKHGYDPDVLTGAMPEIQGTVMTPSGGRHDWITKLGLHKNTGFRPGLDYQGGTEEREGCGFVFVPPTARPSSAEEDAGEVRTYQWVKNPPTTNAFLVLSETNPLLERLITGARTRANGDGSGRVDTDFRNPDIDDIVEFGNQSTEQEPVFRDFVWKLRCTMGRSSALLLWDAAVAKTPARNANWAWTHADFDRLWISAGDKLAEFEPVKVEPWMMERAHQWHMDTIGALLGGSPTYTEAERFEKRLKAERELRLVRRTVDDEELGETFVEPQLKILESFLDEPDDLVQFRVAKLFPAGGRVLLSAQYKAGKTTMRDNLMRSLVDGEPFLGEYACNPVQGRVVVLDLELAEGTMRRWLREQQFVNTDKVVISSLRGRGSSFNIMNDKIMNWWVEHLIKVRCGVLILDCLRPAMDALGLDENREAGQFLVKFDELLDKAGVQDGMVIHHMGHEGERSRGDSRLRDWPDAEWRMLRVDPEDPNSGRTFSAIGRDVNVTQHGLQFDQDTRRLTLGMPTNAQALREANQIEELVPQIVRLVREQPGIITSRIREEIPGQNVMLTRARNLAVEQGLIRIEPGLNRSTLHYPV
jgi:hypothetical protein